MKLVVYSWKRADWTNYSSKRQGYLMEQCKMLGGTVNLDSKLKNRTFKELAELVKRVSVMTTNSLRKVKEINGFNTRSKITSD